MPTRAEFEEALEHAQAICDFVLNLLPAEARPGRREMEPNSRDLAEQGDASDYSSNALTEISQFFKRPRKTITAPTVREILMGERARKPV
ncbi:MAG: hypothetical protein ABSC18_13610 [Verrucomicrobiota bacterium]|jgi:hypothetical protein